MSGAQFDREKAASQSLRNIIIEAIREAVSGEVRHAFNSLDGEIENSSERENSQDSTTECWACWHRPANAAEDGCPIIEGVYCGNGAHAYARGELRKLRALNPGKFEVVKLEIDDLINDGEMVHIRLVVDENRVWRIADAAVEASDLDRSEHEMETNIQSVPVEMVN